MNAQRSLGELVYRERSVRRVAVVQRSSRDILDHMRKRGFPRMVLEAQFPVSMSGSGHEFQAYVFRVLPRVMYRYDLSL